MSHKGFRVPVMFLIADVYVHMRNIKRKRTVTYRVLLQLTAKQQKLTM